MCLRLKYKVIIRLGVILREPLASCHSERSEESDIAQGDLGSG
ncbi:unnamed protein product [marine sediment metagenome]|uniref:Uncharacterized protein n=1 Tax=marine sediment metagenome TaxID=412755 RepID=X1HGN4_9ZZZZ